MKIIDLVRFVAGDVPGCPGPVIELEILQAAIDFCRSTHAWSEIQSPVTIVNNVQEYDVDMPADGTVVTVRNVWAFSRELPSKTMADIQRLIPNWVDAKSNQPAYFNMASTEPAYIRLFPIPYEATGTLVMRVVYAPKITSTTLDDALVERYLDTLMAGAKARLMLQPGRSWTNPALGGVNDLKFRNGKVEAKLNVMSENTPGTVIVQPQRFM